MDEHEPRVFPPLEELPKLIIGTNETRRYSLEEVLADAGITEEELRRAPDYWVDGGYDG